MSEAINMATENTVNEHMGANGSNIFEKGCLLGYTAGFWTGRKRLKNDQYDVGDTDADFVRAVKHLVNPTYIKKIVSIANTTRAHLYELGYQFDIRGVLFVPQRRIPEANDYLTGQKRLFDAAVDEFVSQYAVAVSDAEVKLGHAFNRCDYPSADKISERFRFDWSFYQVSGPSAVSVVDPALLAQEQARFRSMVDGFKNDAMLVLRERFASVVGRMVEMTTGGKRIVESAVDNFLGFLDEFEKMDITNDKELGGLIEQARAIASTGIDPDELRKLDSFKKSVGQNMTTLAEKIETLIENAPSRLLRK